MRDDAHQRAEDAQQQATEFVKELYASGHIDAGRFDESVTGILAATTETELGEVVRSLPQRREPPVPGLPLIRLDMITNIGRICLRHPAISVRRTKGVPR